MDVTIHGEQVRIIIPNGAKAYMDLIFEYDGKIYRRAIGKTDGNVKSGFMVSCNGGKAWKFIRTQAAPKPVYIAYFQIRDSLPNDDFPGIAGRKRKPKKIHVPAPECAVIKPDGRRKEYTKRELLDYIDLIIDDNLFHAAKYGYAETYLERYRKAAAEYKDSIKAAFMPGTFPEFQWDSEADLPASPAFSWDEYQKQEKADPEEKRMVLHGTAGTVVRFKRVMYTLTCDISFPPNPSICYAYPMATAYRTHKPEERFNIVWGKMDKKELYQWVENGDFNADIYAVMPDDDKAFW